MKRCGICGRRVAEVPSDAPQAGVMVADPPCALCLELAQRVAEHLAPLMRAERRRLDVPFPSGEGPSVLAFYWLVRIAEPPRRKEPKTR